MMTREQHTIFQACTEDAIPFWAEIPFRIIRQPCGGSAGEVKRDDYRT
jgi:hypothetical protein